jgi:hypothetical protein
LLRDEENEVPEFIHMVEPISNCVSLATKLYKGELEDEDWNEVVKLTLLGAIWLFKKSRVEVTPSSSQLHFQPLKAKKKKKKKKNEKS